MAAFPITQILLWALFGMLVFTVLANLILHAYDLYQRVRRDLRPVERFHRAHHFERRF